VKRKAFLRPVLMAACAAWSLIGPPIFASAEIDEAARAIDDGIPEVAVVRLQKLADTLRGEEALEAKQRLAEALIAAARPATALRLLEDPSLVDSINAKFLRAQAMAELKRFDEALALYQQVENRSGPQQRSAAFGVAEMLRAIGRTDDAIRQYHVLDIDPRFGVRARLREAELLIVKQESAMAKRSLDQVQAKTLSDKRQKRLLRARLELLNQRPDKTVELLDSIAKKPEGESHETVIAVLFVLADAHLRMNTPELGDDYLEDFIEKHPDDVELPRVFAKLDQLYRTERRVPRNELEKWSRDSTQPRRGLAQWYLAQIELRAGHRDEAIRRFEEVRKAMHPMLLPAVLQYAQLLLDSGRADEALAVLGETERLQPEVKMREQIRFETARAMYSRAEFAQASTGFQQVANSTAEFAHPALFNAALGWLRANDGNRLAVASKELADGGDHDAEAGVLLETALASAQRNESKATALLQDFVRRFPSNSRVADAYLALAEMAYHSSPPNLDQARKNLAAAQAAHPSEAVGERADYLAIWLADAAGEDSDRVITAATDFLRVHPKSPLTGEVRLKLAETHFRRQDFANAQTQFELLAQENASSPLTEKALFLAAQSAMATMTARSSDRALELLAQVVKMNGELRWAARNEQAAIERRLGKPQEAQLLYDEVLKGDARGAEKREALCGKADAFFEQANADAANLQRAVAVYDQLASEAANQPHWRNQALFKKGVCLEKESDNDGALSTFYKILEFNPEPGKPPEFFWFYKAGFNAARLLEEQQKWESAVAIYEKLVAAKGPRSDEAKGRLDQLRLEHFLWQ
jgi:outer membrane protein assembly factor BamD (BamD/ComL family)